MKKQVLRVLLTVGCIALLSSGCAKKDMVRTEQPLAPSAAAAAIAPPAAQHQAPADVSSTAATPPGQPAAQAKAAPVPLGASELAAPLENVYFDFDRYTLSAAARESLAKTAAVVAEKGAKLQIAGHCDERGSDEYNLALSEQRAVAARDYLVALGVPQEKLQTIAYGKEKPAVFGHDEGAWSQNRRDEFLVMEK